MSFKSPTKDKEIKIMKKRDKRRKLYDDLNKVDEYENDHDHEHESEVEVSNTPTPVPTPISTPVATPVPTPAATPMTTPIPPQIPQVLFLNSFVFCEIVRWNSFNII